eukprot:COSAG01_NODE_2195_length_8181_cov_180.569414_4_plen_53_part_00
MTHKLGWGQWEELKYHIRSEPLFRFDWFLKSRTPLESVPFCTPNLALYVLSS